MESRTGLWMRKDRLQFACVPAGESSDVTKKQVNNLQDPVSPESHRDANFWNRFCIEHGALFVAS
jgi:hypothetical protein